MLSHFLHFAVFKADCQCKAVIHVVLCDGDRFGRLILVLNKWC